MNQRRGYCLSAAIIALDLLLTPFGGWLAAAVSLVWAGGLGEWAARNKTADKTGDKRTFQADRHAI